jgi:hypothetical protein
LRKGVIPVKKTSFLFAVLFCFLGFAVLLGNDGSSFDDSLGAVEIGNTSTSSSSDSSTVKSDEKASEESKTKTEEAKEEKKEEEKKGMATLPDGIAYVGVYSYLNLRSSIWGAVIGELYNNEEVTITGRDGDWYMVSTSKGDGYAHARYIFATKDARYQGNDVTASDVIINVSGDTVQGRVVNAAKQLVDTFSESGSFPYAPGTNGGRLGCAQVVTTALKAAGVINETSLGCIQTIGLLEDVGWKAVDVPPYQAGDVIFWETYCSGPSHVGIIMTSGNSATAMSNSSSQRKPRYHDAEYQKVVKVMRKV